MAPIEIGATSAVLKHAAAYAYKGTSQSWLAQLLSPALIQWLERSADDFGFELADGVLCVGRGGYLTRARERCRRCCEEAAHLAGAIREESLEEVGTDGGEVEAAKDPGAADPRMEAALRSVAIEAPATPTAAEAAFKQLRASGARRRSSARSRSPLLVTLAAQRPRRQRSRSS